MVSMELQNRSNYCKGGGGLRGACCGLRLKSPWMLLTTMAIFMMLVLQWEESPLSSVLFFRIAPRISIPSSGRRAPYSELAHDAFQTTEMISSEKLTAGVKSFSAASGEAQIQAGYENIQLPASEKSVTPESSSVPEGKAHEINEGTPHDVKELLADATENIQHDQNPTAITSMETPSWNPGESSSVCDYSVGEWVADPVHHPLYTGKECALWLSPLWSCRQNKRPDLGYEHFRWQPAAQQQQECALTPFSSHNFLRRLKNKVLAFVGDSLARQQFQSLMCMITATDSRDAHKSMVVVKDVGATYGFKKLQSSGRVTGLAYHFEASNTTIIFHWSATLCELQMLNRSDPMSAIAMHLDRPTAFVRDYLSKIDVLVLNSGHHWNRGKMNLNKWQSHVNGIPVAPKDPLYRITNAYNFAIAAVAKRVSDKIENTNKQVFYRTLSPRHFRNGDWNTGGACDDVKFFDKNVTMKSIQDGLGRDLVAENAVVGTKLQLLNITLLSQLRGEAHISKYGAKQRTTQDCLHWCLPGIPDTWNEILFNQILSTPNIPLNFEPIHQLEQNFK